MQSIGKFIDFIFFLSSFAKEEPNYPGSMSLFAVFSPNLYLPTASDYGRSLKIGSRNLKRVQVTGLVSLRVS